MKPAAAFYADDMTPAARRGGAIARSRKALGIQGNNQRVPTRTNPEMVRSALANPSPLLRALRPELRGVK